MSAFDRGRRFCRDRRRSLAINVAPLIDVLFLLLIFLLVSTTFKVRPALKVELPRAHGRQTAVGRVTLVVGRGGAYNIEGRRVPRGELRESLVRLRLRKGGRGLDLEVDRNSRSEALVFALDVARSAGYKQISLPTVRARERESNAGNGKPGKGAGPDDPVPD